MSIQTFQRILTIADEHGHKVHSRGFKVCTIVTDSAYDADRLSLVLRDHGLPNRIIKGHFTHHHYVGVHYGRS